MLKTHIGRLSLLAGLKESRLRLRLRLRAMRRGVRVASVDVLRRLVVAFIFGRHRGRFGGRCCCRRPRRGPRRRDKDDDDDLSAQRLPPGYLKGLPVQVAGNGYLADTHLALE